MSQPPSSVALSLFLSDALSPNTHLLSPAYLLKIYFSGKVLTLASKLKENNNIVICTSLVGEVFYLSRIRALG